MQIVCLRVRFYKNVVNIAHIQHSVLLKCSWRLLVKMLVFLNKFSTKLCDPLFLESVFCQKLEKTGFSFVRDRESDETHSFRVALTYKLHNSFFLLIAQTRRVSTTTQHLEGLFSLISRSRTKLKPVFSSFWQKTDSKNKGGRKVSC